MVVSICTETPGVKYFQGNTEDSTGTSNSNQYEPKSRHNYPKDLKGFFLLELYMCDLTEGS